MARLLLLLLLISATAQGGGLRVIGPHQKEGRLLIRAHVRPGKVKSLRAGELSVGPREQTWFALSEGETSQLNTLPSGQTDFRIPQGTHRVTLSPL